MIDYVTQMVEEAKMTMEAQKKAANESKTEIELKKLLKRTVDKEGFTPDEIQELALIYKNLAPNDTTSYISIRMMNEFCMEMKEQYPNEYQKMRWYFKMEPNEMTQRKREKIALSVEKFLDKFRTVENCYKYSKGFKEMSDRIACKLDAPENMQPVERVKWLRMWFFLIRNQNLFWNDTESDGGINIYQSDRFDKEGYLTPDIMIEQEEKSFSILPEGCIILDMVKAFINLYSKEIQDEIIRFAELDRNEHYILDPREIRNNLKKKIFPVRWISGTNYFLTKLGISLSRKEFITFVVDANKKGFKNLPTFEQEMVDPYNHYAIKPFVCYELGEILVEGEQRSFAVSSEEEFKMYIEVYKWISLHPDFKFGAEEDSKKTLKEYGIQCFVDEQKIENADWFSDITQKMKSAEGKSEMKSALKRIQRLGRESASKRDIKYLNYFEYLMKKNPKDLPRNVVNLYGKVFF